MELKISTGMRLAVNMYTLGCCFLLFSFSALAKDRDMGAMARANYPRLLLTVEGAKEIKKSMNKYPLMQNSVKDVILSASSALEREIEVPVPKDPGGGYTHEKHKQNYTDMYNAGLAYQLTGDSRYARFVEKMLLEYAGLYPTLGLHPEQKNQAPGKLFWQGLNETVWLVYSIQAYDCIRDVLSADTREEIEQGVFRPMVHFFTVEDPSSFNRVHNHGTWSVASVGMAGIVLNEPDWVKKALWGTSLTGEAGFLKQLDQLFSPDGYFAEGPYYQRYALLPFLVFAQALENNYPEIGIFKYRNKLLAKMVQATIQLTDDNGRFFPFNDAIKEKDYTSDELVFGVNIAYSQAADPSLLDVAKEQKKVMISMEGLSVARDLAKGKASPFMRKSLLLRDGQHGDQGGVAIMRNDERYKGQTLVFKFTSQGMGHGHFDRLNCLFYNGGEEVIQDYGAARFVNVEPKDGGRYLPENTSWAKQTIAHNTVTLNRRSHYDANLKKSEEHAPSLLFHDFSDINAQVAAAVDSNCYNNAILRRAMALVSTSDGPLVLDFLM
jgi:oligo-alginate lyase